MAELRQFEIPETVRLLGTFPYPFVACVEFLITTDHRYNDNGAAIRAGIETKAEIKGKKPGDIVSLEEPNMKLLRDVLDEPHDLQGKKSGRWGIFSTEGLRSEEIIVPGAEFLSYMDAVSEKAVEKTAEKVKAAAKSVAKAKNKAKRERKEPPKKKSTVTEIIKNPAKAPPSKGLNGARPAAS
jgi:hypothetical protein